MAPHDLKERLATLGKYSEIFEVEGFQFGRWDGGTADSHGVIEMPFYSLSAPVSAFIDYCYEDGWVLEGFDWVEWRNSSEAIELRDGPIKVARASSDQLAKLLTTLLRQDRFSGGTLVDAHESGLLMSIVRRAKALSSM